MAKTKSVSFFAAVVLLATGFVYFALAWTEPTQAPPGGNVPQPLNVGSAAQTKSGDLTVQGTGSFLNNLSVGSDNWNVGGWAAPGPSARVISGYYGGYGIQKLNARAGAFSAIAGANPGSSFSVIMVPWDGTTANLDTLCQTKINPGWHAQVAVKGNYFNQAFDGSDFFAYSTAITSQSEFDTYKSTGTQWWIGCSTLSAWSKPTIGGYWTGSGNNIYNNNTGNVGIGTTAPGSYKLNVAGSIRSDYDNSYITVGDRTFLGWTTYPGWGGGGWNWHGWLSFNAYRLGTDADNVWRQTNQWTPNWIMEARGDKISYKYGAQTANPTFTPLTVAWITGSGGAYYAGNVGIGTTIPASNEKLRIETPEGVWGAVLSRSGSLVGGIHSNSGILTLQAGSGGAYVAVANNGNVGIGMTNPSYKLDVNGTARAGQTYLSNSDIYFTNTSHSHTGIGNTAGYAAIENAANYNTLMILGRAGTSVGRSVSVWDYLTVNGSQRITGSLTVDGGGSFGQPITVGVPTAASHAATKSYVDSAVSGGTGIAANSYACSADGTCETTSILNSGGTINNPNSSYRWVGGGSWNTFYTPSGYIQLGPANTSWAHIYTDRANTIFNTPVYSVADTFSSYDADLQLQRIGSTKLTLTSSGATVSGNLTVGGGLTVSGGAVLGETTSGHYYFKGVGGDSGQANAYYGIYQEAGAWTHPYPDLRIQYHTGIKYDAYYAYGGHRFYTNYDATGNPYGLAFSVGDGDHNVRVVNNLYAGALCIAGVCKSDWGSIGGTADNSKACSADGICETNNISASGNLTVTGSAQAVKFDGAYIPRYQTWASQGTGAGGAAIYNDDGSYKALMVVGSDQGQGYARWVRVWDSLWANTRVDAPIYYDSSNTGYYVDPASTSRLNTISGDRYYDSKIDTGGSYLTAKTWLEFTSNVGSYWSNNGWHIYPYDNHQMRFRSGASDWGAIRANTAGTDRNYIYWNSSNEIGFLTTDGSWALRVDNSKNAQVYGNLTVSGSLGSSAAPVPKIYVTTIDPVYEIDGKKYATYVSDFAGGVRTETSGIVKLLYCYIVKAGYCKEIDFENLEKGSDLWLFWETSNKKMSDLVVILTPAFDGKVWYEKQGNKLVIYGEKEGSPNQVSQSETWLGEVSYRLTLPRQDEQQWDNLIDE